MRYNYFVNFLRNLIQMSLFSKRLPTPKSELFAALDIGTSKVCCTIARAVGNKYQDQAPLKVTGIGYQLSKGLRSGNIIDLEALEDSILNAVHAAEQSAGQNINSVYVAILEDGLSHTVLKLNCSSLITQWMNHTSKD